jgi:cell volume regulation protein A
MEMAAGIALVGILVFLAHLFSGLFSRTRVPDVLLLMLIGVLLGPTLGLVTPRSFGVVGPFFSTVTLVILLFEAGVHLDIDVLLTSLHRCVPLTLTSFALAMTAVAAISFFVLHLQFTLALMLGAIVGSTSPAVIVPLTRKLEMEEPSRGVLLMESALSDVLSIVIALAILDAYRLGHLQIGVLAGQILSMLLLAAIFGILAAFVWSALLKRVRGLENSIFTTPAFVFVLFGIVELLGYSGYIAALAFGATLGNIEAFHRLGFLKRLLPAEPISLNQVERDFIAEIVFLLTAFFFIFIGISMHLRNLPLLALGFSVTVVLLLLRLLAARLTLTHSTSVRDASLIAVMTPKGLAAAVLAGIALQNNLPNGDTIQRVTYSIILFSIVLTSLLTFLVDRSRLGRLYAFVFRGFSHPAAQSLAKTA